MAIMINDSSPCAAVAASRALSLAIRVDALADEIGALHRDIRAAHGEPVRWSGLRCDGNALDTRRCLQGARAGLGEEFT